MGGESRSSRYLLLQVWCGLLTVAMVVMAAVLTSITLKTAKKDGVSTSHLGNTSQTAHTVLARYMSKGSPLSYIQLTTSLHGHSWQNDINIPSCDSCSLVLHENSVHCTKSGLYFFYAQVNFSKDSSQTKSVMLTRDFRVDKNVKLLVEGTFPVTTEGSVWVSQIVFLEDLDSISFKITDDFQKEGTYWGVYELH
ncbi:lymphotoxin-alpha [Genypterus blacodes]|uniref:lymphotoxin-alpha n=1 Tax=Genypterus blacodes TaxID=154954 RepID=UPI003F768B9D